MPSLKDQYQAVWAVRELANNRYREYRAADESCQAIWQEWEAVAARGRAFQEECDRAGVFAWRSENTATVLRSIADERETVYLRWKGERQRMSNAWHIYVSLQAEADAMWKAVRG